MKMKSIANKYLPQTVFSWIVCFSAALFFAYELVQLHMLNAIAPMLLKDFGIGASKFGYLCSTYLLADVIFLLPAGIILDRFSTRNVIVVALALCVLGTFGFSFAQNFEQACVCHFLSGIGNAFCFLSCMILVSRWFPPQKQAFIVGLMITVGLLGGVIAQSPFSALAEALNWRQALVVDGFIGLFILLIVFLFVHDKGSQEVEEYSGEKIPFMAGIKASLLNSQNIFCGLYTGLMNLPVMVIGAVWGSLFLTQIHHISLSASSFIVSMICLGTIIGSPIFGYLSDKMGKRTPLMLFGATMSLLVFGFILLLNQPSTALLITLFLLLGFFTSTQVIGYPTITESNPPALTGTSMGIAAVIIMGLPMLLQPLTGKLIELGWDGRMVDGVPLYGRHDFLAAFSIFPIGFILSFVLARMIREPKELEQSLETL